MQSCIVSLPVPAAMRMSTIEVVQSCCPLQQHLQRSSAMLSKRAMEAMQCCGCTSAGQRPKFLMGCQICHTERFSSSPPGILCSHLRVFWGHEVCCLCACVCDRLFDGPHQACRRKQLSRRTSTPNVGRWGPGQKLQRCKLGTCSD